MKTFKQHLNEAHCEMTKMVTDYVKDKKEPTWSKGMEKRVGDLCRGV